ncbi:PDC sensor domain-containing protein [Thalassomonas sp. RHCl1]|uniref:PDC sensor domain-containing protein n=1 Tax=Thalassomonas sp. RHCl1 TaxID=2995320 RepID=UPI00248BF714|nr:PDC sensor domain-containing protein [Thalassomonas sp. RHCl1]
MFIRLLFLSLSLFFIHFVFAQQGLTQEQLQAAVGDKIAGVEKMGGHPLVVKAVKEQNAKGMSLEEIKKIDQEWRATAELTPFKLSLQQSVIGKFLKRKLELNKAIYSETFLTDNQGANVVAYPATSDYWQGDEKKWTEAFNNGDGKVYVGEVKYDESAQSDATQISVPVKDQGKTIGVLVVGIKLSYIEASKLKK